MGAATVAIAIPLTYEFLQFCLWLIKLMSSILFSSAIA